MCYAVLNQFRLYDGWCGRYTCHRQLGPEGSDHCTFLGNSLWCCVGGYSDAFDDFLRRNGSQPLWLSTTKGALRYTDVRFEEECWLLFGRESAGLPAWLREKYPDRCIRIPMIEGARSMNLGNSVALLCYEALRQQGFPGLV